MASKENQEALKEILTCDMKYCSRCLLKKDCKIPKAYSVLQLALDELQNLKENYIGFEDMNYELKVYKKAFELVFNKLVMVLIKLNQVVEEDTLKQSFIVKAKEELEREKQ